MTVPVGLYPPLTVALSAIELPTVALAGCWLVLIVGLAVVMVTGSAAVPLVTDVVVGSRRCRWRPSSRSPSRSRCSRPRWPCRRTSVSVSVNSGVPLAVRVVVEVEGDGAGRVVPAADRGLVGDRAADGGAGRLLGGVDRRAGRGDGHRLGGGAAADRGCCCCRRCRWRPSSRCPSRWRCSPPRWPCRRTASRCR